MAVSEEYRRYVEDQLAGVAPIVSRRMFGGAGLYAGGCFFAIIADDVVYFKTDAGNRDEYAAKGMKPFKPYSGRPATMQYHQVPADVLDDREALAAWARDAIQAARRRDIGKPPRRRSGSKA